MWILVQVHVQLNDVNDAHSSYVLLCSRFFYLKLFFLFLFLTQMKVYFVAKNGYILLAVELLFRIGMHVPSAMNFQHEVVLAGGTDICYGSDWVSGIHDGRGRGNRERHNHHTSHVSFRGWCFPGDVLHLSHVHLYWSVGYDSFHHWKCCDNGFLCCVIFHRFATLSPGIPYWIMQSQVMWFVLFLYLGWATPSCSQCRAFDFMQSCITLASIGVAYPKILSWYCMGDLVNCSVMAWTLVCRIFSDFNRLSNLWAFFCEWTN